MSLRVRALLMVTLLIAGTALATAAFLTANARAAIFETAASHLPESIGPLLINPFVQTGLLAIALSIFGSLITWLGMRVFIRPLDKLRRAAMAVQAGTYNPEKFKPMTLRKDEAGNIARVFDSMARDVMARDRRLKLLRVVIPIGVALSAEKDFNRLLEEIVIEAQNVTNADGGSLYLCTPDETLQFVIVRNVSLDIHLGGTSGNAVTFNPIPLYLESGAPNHHNVASHVVLTGERVNIADAYETTDFDFSGTKAFDQNTGYRSKSFMAIPLKSDEGKVIGVLQLINAQDAHTGAVEAFPDDDVIDSLGLMTSAALTGYMREQNLRQEIVQLRIEIDHAKQAKQVAEITGTDYFQELKQKADRLRAKRKE
jgi:HAMP domain-containing protein